MAIGVFLCQTEFVSETNQPACRSLLGPLLGETHHERSQLATDISGKPGPRFTRRGRGRSAAWPGAGPATGCEDPGGRGREDVSVPERSGNPSRIGGSAWESSAMASASSARPLASRIIPTSRWPRSATSFPTAAPPWPRFAAAPRRIPRSKSWSRTIASRRSSSRPMRRAMQGTATSSSSTASTWPARCRPSSARSRMPINCSRRSSRADGST